MKRPIRAAAILLTLAAIASPAAAQEKRLDHDAYDIWKSIEDERVSDDGRWVLYTRTVRIGDPELVVVGPDGQEHRIPRGEEGRFSADSRFAIFTVVPAHDSVRTLRLADTPPDLPKDTLGVLTLATGEVARVPGVEEWTLSEKGQVVVYLTETPEPEEAEGGEPDAAGEEPAEEEPTEGAEAEGDDRPEKPDTHTLVIRDLESGAEHRFDHVASYAVDEDGVRVAYTASSEDGTEDGVFLVETSTGAATAVATGEGLYEQLVLSEDGEQVAFLTNRDTFLADQPEYVLFHAWDRDPARAVASSVTAGVPSDWWVSEHGELEFSASGERLFFGTAPRPEPQDEDEEPLLEEEQVELDVWHWQDDLIQPMQKLQADRERRRTYRAVAHLGRDRVVQLANEDMPEVEVGREGDADIALAETNVRYLYLVGIESPGYSDVYLVEVDTGDRRMVVEEERIGWGHLSPDARYFAWYDYDDRRWFTLRADIGRDVILKVSCDIDYPVWDETDDHPMAPYPYGTAGWTEDDEAMLVYDRFDIWAVDPDCDGAPRRITEGWGREHDVELRYVRLDEEERAIDPGAPMLLSAFDIYTKEAGFFRDRVDGADRPVELVYAPKRFNNLSKAEDVEVLLYTREDVQEFPDLWIADTDFDGARKISRVNPQQGEYNWATVELMEWLSTDGTALQGLLYKPEDFDPSREYPMMVYFYERNSDNLHRHAPPLPHRSIIQPTFYASRGYLVFIPDIVYREGFPGESAMDCVMPGVLRLAAEPWVDADNVGVQGHSWGGYQIAYMVTQTDFFKAAEAGAPVSNMTSAYGGIRWGSGLSRMFQYERTQSRIGGSLWDRPIRYIENSPLFFLDKVETPLLIMHNDEDGAVPWYQGIELFVALRRLGKPTWMIVYNEQPHWPITEANKKDWNIRMQQFFDHYLKGAPAPVWLEEGIPATAKGETLGLELVEETGEDGR
ncbi:MAG: prolyl oligopeptidase family serine peptidase [Longimicrobiales bacterium]|nr:prolyl oligopeptidase family serine peptidase [Longimicrobiales bacterium]